MPTRTGAPCGRESKVDASRFAPRSRVRGCLRQGDWLRAFASGRSALTVALCGAADAALDPEQRRPQVLDWNGRVEERALPAIAEQAQTAGGAHRLHLA